MNKAQNDKNVVSSIAGQAGDLYEQINVSDARMDDYYRFAQLANDALNPDLSEDERFKAQTDRDILGQQALMKSGKTDEPHLFSDLLNSDGTMNSTSELHAMIFAEQSDALLNAEKLGKLDAQYTEATGGGYGLEDLGFSFNNPSRNPNYEPPPTPLKIKKPKTIS